MLLVLDNAASVEQVPHSYQVPASCWWPVATACPIWSPDDWS